MTLKNNLYSIISLNRDNNSASVELLPDSLIYKAHFPERPITPGVCIIQIVTEILGEFKGINLSLIEVKNVKFLEVLSPSETKTVSINFDKILEEDNSIKVRGTVADEAKIYTKFSLIYK